MKRFLTFIAAFLFAVMSFGQDAAEKFNQANEALKAQDYVKAFTLFDEAMKNPGDVQIDKAVNYNIGYAAYKSGNMEGAEKYFGKAIEDGVNVSKCYENLALGYNDKKNYAKSVECFEKAISASEEDTAPLVYNAGIIAYKGEMLDKAVELFSKSYSNGYKGETAIYYKAVILNKQGKKDEFKETLEEDIQKFPGDSKIGPALAKIYVLEGNDIYTKGAEIVAAINKKITAGSLTTNDAAYNAEIEKAKVEFKNAAIVLEKAKALDPENANALKLLEACSAALK